MKNNRIRTFLKEEVITERFSNTEELFKFINNKIIKPNEDFLKIVGDFFNKKYVPIGIGSTRLAMEIPGDKNYILKIALNDKGVTQNKNEVEVYLEHGSKPYAKSATEIIKLDPKYIYYKAERVIPSTQEDDLTNVIGLDFKYFTSYIEYECKIKGYEEFKDERDFFVQKANKKALEVAKDMVKFITSANINATDLTNHENYGTKNGEIKLLDFGLLNRPATNMEEMLLRIIKEEAEKVNGDEVKNILLSPPKAKLIWSSGKLDMFLGSLNGLQIQEILTDSPIALDIWESKKLDKYLNKLTPSNIKSLLISSPVAEKIWDSGKLDSMYGDFTKEDLTFILLHSPVAEKIVSSKKLEKLYDKLDKEEISHILKTSKIAVKLKNDAKFSELAKSKGVQLSESRLFRIIREEFSKQIKTK